MLYSLLKKILFLRDPEEAHDLAMRRLEQWQASGLGSSLLKMLAGTPRPVPVDAMGLHFKHPLGMAAGFDKDARVILALQYLGFSHVEIGTVTPRPQPGNEKPRVWRFPGANALVNALGFPGEGMVKVRSRLFDVRSSGKLRIPVGINLGKNFDTSAADAAQDYTTLLDGLHDVGHYFVVNVSSPNTQGLRNLQTVEFLRPLLTTLMEKNVRRGKKPLLVKIAPDLADEDIIAIGRLAKELELAGIVAGNTTIRRELVTSAALLQRGGLSGAPLYPRTIEMLKLLKNELSPEQTLIAAGGIFTSQQFQECLSNGARLCQVYTAFIYHGPRCARKLVRL